jgi:putative protein-disulfide isomerase
MMTVELRLYTDPACERSWGAEPQLRHLLWEFGDELAPRLVMAGLARSLDAGDHARLLAAWLDVAAETEMPCDLRLWLANPISSTYPACQAVIAAREQGAAAAAGYLRRLREGLFCERLKLDHLDSLIAAAGAAGLDRDRFEIDLRSHAITEAFGADLDEVRAHDPPLELPTVALTGADGGHRELRGPQPYEAYREAALQAGAEPVREGAAEPLEAIGRFGRCATAELVEMSGRPRPVVEAELWALAREWRIKPVPVLTGTLWESA